MLDLHIFLCSDRGSWFFCVAHEMRSSRKLLGFAASKSDRITGASTVLRQWESES